MLKPALGRCLPACLQVTGGGRGGLCDVKWRSRYYQLIRINRPHCYYQSICINRPHCCKFLLNQHQLPCLSLPSSLLYFLPCPSSARASAGASLPVPPFPRARDATVWLPLRPCLQPCSSPPDRFPFPLPVAQFGSGISPGKPLANASYPLTEGRVGTPGIIGTGPCQGATAGGRRGCSICRLTVLCSACPVAQPEPWVQASTVTCAGAALAGPSSTWSPLAKAAKILYLI